MGFGDIFLGSECGVDIYEENDENTWVRCSMKQSKLGIVVLIPIVIMVILICTAFWGMPGAVISTSIGTLVIISSVAYHVLWAKKSARIQYRRSQKEIKSRIDSGMSKAEAIKEIQAEVLAREHIAAMRANNHRNGNRTSIRFG